MSQFDFLSTNGSVVDSFSADSASVAARRLFARQSKANTTDMRSSQFRYPRYGIGGWECFNPLYDEDANMLEARRHFTELDEMRVCGESYLDDTEKDHCAAIVGVVQRLKIIELRSSSLSAKNAYARSAADALLSLTSYLSE